MRRRFGRVGRGTVTTASGTATGMNGACSRGAGSGCPPDAGTEASGCGCGFDSRLDSELAATTRFRPCSFARYTARSASWTSSSAPVASVGNAATPIEIVARIGLARRLDLEAACRERTTDPVGDLERLRGGRLGEEDRELLAAEAGGDVVVPELLAEDVGDAAQHRVACEMAVVVVDVAKQVEVAHEQRERPVETLRARQLVHERGREVACVEEVRLRVDARLQLQRGHRE